MLETYATKSKIKERNSDLQTTGKNLVFVRRGHRAKETKLDDAI